MRLLSKYVLIPLLEKRANGSTSKCQKELERTQWLPRDELKQLQEARLQRLLKHAYKNVPYYQSLFDEEGLKPGDIRTTEDLRKLPILTKDNVRRNFNELVAQNYDKNQMKIASTGGTTGEPLKFYVPRDRGQSWGALWRGLHWYGFEPGDKWAEIWSHPFKETILTNMSQKLSQLLRRFIFLSAFELTEGQMQLFAYRIKKFKPRYLIAYPSAAYILAEYIKQQSIDITSLRVVVTTAEKLYDYERETIKETFGCDVFEYYGGGEVLSMAYECPEHHGLHISAENVILEIVRDDGQPSHPGEMGRIVVTDLNNYAMPFIRYENGDLGILSAIDCPCGRGLPLLESVEGRIADVIVTKDGFISSPILTTIFKNLRVRQYQITQESGEEIFIKIMKGEGYSQEDTDYIVNTMHQYVGDDMRIQIQFVDSIPLTMAGKRRVVISKVPLKF